MWNKDRERKGLGFEQCLPGNTVGNPQHMKCQARSLWNNEVLCEPRSVHPRVHTRCVSSTCRLCRWTAAARLPVCVHTQLPGAARWLSTWTLLLVMINNNNDDDDMIFLYPHPERGREREREAPPEKYCASPDACSTFCRNGHWSDNETVKCSHDVYVTIHKHGNICRDPVWDVLLTALLLWLPKWKVWSSATFRCFSSFLCRPGATTVSNGSPHLFVLRCFFVPNYVTPLSLSRRMQIAIDNGWAFDHSEPQSIKVTFYYIENSKCYCVCTWCNSLPLFNEFVRTR